VPQTQEPSIDVASQIAWWRLFETALHPDVFVRQCHMTGNEFIRKVKALGKARNIPVVLNASRGKGSHQTLYFGAAFTVIRNPKDELKTGTFHAMCAQLGIKAKDL